MNNKTLFVLFLVLMLPNIVLAQKTIKIRLINADDNTFYTRLVKENLILMDDFSNKYYCSAEETSAVFVFDKIPYKKLYKLILADVSRDNCIKIIDERIFVDPVKAIITKQIYVIDYSTRFDKKNDELSRKEEELKKVKKKIEELKKESSEKSKVIAKRDSLIQVQTSVIDARGLKIRQLEETRDSMQNVIYALKLEISDLQSNSDCQNRKMIEILRILKEQKEKLYYSTMHIIDCECEQFTRKRRRGGIKIGFNIISTSDALFKDSVFVQGKREIISYELSVRANYNEEAKIIKKGDYEAVLSGIGQQLNIGVIEVRNRRKGTKKNEGFYKEIKARKGLYDLIFKNKENFEIGRFQLSALESICGNEENKKEIARKTYKGVPLLVNPNDNVSSNSVSTVFSIAELIKGEFESSKKDSISRSRYKADGDRIKIYDCDKLLKSCHLIAEDFEVTIERRLISHQYRYQEGFILMEQIPGSGTVQGCSIAVEVGESAKYIKLSPSITNTDIKHNQHAAFRYEVDPVEWWFCKINN